MQPGTEDKDFRSENHSEQSLAGRSFTNCSFYNCDFSKTLLQNAKFVACSFHECNLSLPKIDGCRFQDVTFTGCKIVGMDFFKCEKMFFSAAFKKCILQYCNFSDLTMKGTLFTKCKLKECYFTHTCLKGANFSESDLTGTQFQSCDLAQADLSTAVNYFIDPFTNKLKKAKFSLPEAASLLQAFEITLV